MVVRHIRVLLVAMAALLILAGAVAGCTQQNPPAPTAAPAGGQKELPIQPAAAAPTAAPAAAPTKAPAAPTVAPTAAAKPPVAKLAIVPVAASIADTNVITASLPGTTTTVAMGQTGLSNVSVGVPVTLKGAAADPKAAAKTYTWTLTAPKASKAALNKNDANVTKFTPDIPGVYKVDLVVGNDGGKSALQSVQIRAGTFVGIDQGNCAKCHQAEATEWAETGHATQLKREIDGGADPANSHYGEACVRCHSAGYNIGVANGGFADVQAKTGWKFPSLKSIQSGKGNWDSMPAALKNVGNIQCENCHGPAKEHVANKAPMAKSLDEGVCNVCHNGGGSHIKGAEFANSKHSDKDAQAWTYPTGPARQDCVRCHSGKGYISFLKNPTDKAAWDNEPQPVTCSVCHDPHSDGNKAQLRIVGKPVEANGVTKDFGLSATCAECHNARVPAADAVKGSTPHYSAAAEMLSNMGGVDYGQKVADSPHAMLVGTSPVTDPTDKEGKAKLFGGSVPGPCVTCHMWPIIADAKDPNRLKVGDHSFNMVSPDGKFQYTAACQSCHTGIKTFDDLKSKADYDGNGKSESVQAEVAGLMKTLQKAIGDSGIKATDAHPYFDQANKANWTDKQKNAIYNYLFVRGLPGSDGKAAAIHNFKRSVSLLQLSYKDLTGKDVPGATAVQ